MTDTSIPLNGYELANNIIQMAGDNCIKSLINLADGRESDWLEFKASIRPSAEEQAKENVNEDDYYWHIAHAIIGMLNSVGGIILIGIAEDPKKNYLNAIGIQESLDQHEEYTPAAKDKLTRKITEKITQLKGWNVSRGKDGRLKQKYEVKNDTAIGLISIGPIKQFEGKDILPILVKPSECIILVTANNPDREFLSVRLPGEVARIDDITTYNEITSYKEKRKEYLKHAEIRFEAYWRNWNEQQKIQAKSIETPLFQKYLQTLKCEIIKSHLGLDILNKHIEIMAAKRNFKTYTQNPSTEAEYLTEEVDDQKTNIINLLKSERSIWLLGGPGTGKTFSLDLMALHIIEDALKPVNALQKFPVVIRLKRCTQRSTLHDKISTELRHYGWDLTTLNECQIVLFLDGLNEVDLETQHILLNEIAELVHQRENLALIITSRPDTYKDDIGCSPYHLLPLSDDQIECFVRKVSSASESFLPWLHDNSKVRKWASTPLYLSLLCDAYGRSETVSVTNMSKVVKLVVDDICQREKTKGAPSYTYHPDKIKRLLMKLAFETREKGKTSFSRDEMESIFIKASKEYAISIDVIDLIDKTLDMQLLRSEDDVFSFSYEMFQEYFSAVYLVYKESAEVGSLPSFIKEIFTSKNDPYWEHTILLTTGLLPAPETIIREICEFSPLLAAKAYSWISNSNIDLKDYIASSAKEDASKFTSKTANSLTALAILEDFEILKDTLHKPLAFDDTIATAIDDIFISADIHHSLHLLTILSELGEGKKPWFIRAVNMLVLPTYPYKLNKHNTEIVQKLILSLQNSSRHVDILRLYNKFYPFMEIGTSNIENTISDLLIAGIGVHDLPVLVSSLESNSFLMDHYGPSVLHFAEAHFSKPRLKKSGSNSTIQRLNQKITCKLPNKPEARIELIKTGNPAIRCFLGDWIENMISSPDLLQAAIHASLKHYSDHHCLEELCHIVAKHKLFWAVSPHEHLKIIKQVKLPACKEVCGVIESILENGWPSDAEIANTFNEGVPSNIDVLVTRLVEWGVPVSEDNLSTFFCKYLDLANPIHRTFLNYTLPHKIWHFTIVKLIAEAEIPYLFAKASKIPDHFFSKLDDLKLNNPKIGDVFNGNLTMYFDHKLNRYRLKIMCLDHTEQSTDIRGSISEDPNLVAIIDIGTRATRLLFGDVQTLRTTMKFSFKDYTNLGFETFAGSGIKEDNSGKKYYEIKHFANTLHYLKKIMNECKIRNIMDKNIYAVGTEVFRCVENRQILVNIIKEQLGINLLILDPLEEAKTTFFAAMVSCKSYYEFGEPFIVIEQGGGSTQLTIAEMSPEHRPVIHSQISIAELGTIFLRRYFIDNENEFRSDRRLVKTVQRDGFMFAKSKILKAISNMSSNTIPVPKKAFCLGTVITKSIGEKFKSNAKMHGNSFSRADLDFNMPYDHVIRNYLDYPVNSLLSDSRNGLIKESPKDICEIIEIMYGLQCYAAVIDNFSIDTMRLCGTGLRYGVFFRIAYDDWKNIKLFEEPK